MPMLFFMSIAGIAIAHSAGNIVLHDLGLDQALKISWKNLVRKWRTLFWLGFLFMILFTLSFMTKGAGFFITAPLYLALIRISYFAVESSAARLSPSN
jgi:L-asparagine transporter-like permease